MVKRNQLIVLTSLIVLGACVICQADPAPIVTDALGGTLARDHQSRAMYFQGKLRRTYLNVFGRTISTLTSLFYDHR